MLLEAIILIISVYLVVVIVNYLRPKRMISSDWKAVLITGCDSGFGKQLAHRLCEMGFRVYATVQNRNSAGAKELKADPLFVNQLLVWQMDVANDSDVSKVLDRVKTDLDTSHHVLWAVVNNASVYPVSLLEWGTLDTYKNTFEVNVFGTVRVTRAFLPLVRASHGRITNMASYAGRVAGKPNGVYSMSKFSIIAFTDTLRREMRRFGVKVSSIEHGYFKTTLNEPQFMFKRMNESWIHSSEEVKESYVSPQNDLNYFQGCLDVCPQEANIDKVVDLMIDSIVNQNPKYSYSCYGLKLRIILYLDMFCPHLLDSLLNLLEKIILTD